MRGFFWFCFVLFRFAGREGGKEKEGCDQLIREARWREMGKILWCSNFLLPMLHLHVVASESNSFTNLNINLNHTNDQDSKYDKGDGWEVLPSASGFSFPSFSTCGCSVGWGMYPCEFKFLIDHNPSESKTSKKPDFHLKQRNYNLVNLAVFAWICT